MMDRKLIFVHIPKTGGTTLDQVLNREANGRVYWLSGGAREAMQRLSEMPSEQITQYDLFAGHLPWGLHSVLPTPCHYVTMLRHPVERLVSHYFHVHGEPEHRSYKQIVEGGMSLLDFVTSDITLEVDNLQTRFVAGLEANDATPLDGCSEELLSIAKQNIQDSFVGVGVQEWFDHSLLLLSDTLGWKHQPFYVSQRVNSSRPREREIDTEVRGAILARNQMDVQLHEWATGLVKSKVESGGSAFQERLERFRTTRLEWQEQQAAQAT